MGTPPIFSAGKTLFTSLLIFIRKIVFIGGHHNTALAVIDSLQRKCRKAGTSDKGRVLSDSGCRIFWIGHKYSMWGDKNESAEYKEVTSRKIPFYDLKAGKLYRTWNPFVLIRIPFGFVQAVYYLLKIRPGLIVSFGGYLAVPVVIAGFVLGIPSVTHEQTVVTGLANWLISRFAKKIFVTWDTSCKYFPRKKVVLTGLPLRKEIFAKDRIKFKDKLPVVYITGGKQGSHIINMAVRDGIPALLEFCNIIHQCGSSSLYNDYESFIAMRNKLPNSRKRRYMVKDYFSSSEVGRVLRSADLVVGRSGAHTVYELAVLGKPALLIPIPRSSQNEQYKNAILLRDIGNAEVLPQKDLDSAALIEGIRNMLKNINDYIGVKRAVKLDAAETITDEIFKVYAKSC